MASEEDDDGERRRSLSTRERSDFVPLGSGMLEGATPAREDEDEGERRKILSMRERSGFASSGSGAFVGATEARIEVDEVLRGRREPANVGSVLSGRVSEGGDVPKDDAEVFER